MDENKRVLIFPSEPEIKPFVSSTDEAGSEGLKDMVCVQEVVGDPLSAVQICLEAGIGDLTDATTFLNEVIYRIKDFKYQLMEQGEKNAYLN